MTYLPLCRVCPLLPHSPQVIVDQVHAEVEADLAAARDRLDKAIEEVGI